MDAAAPHLFPLPSSFRTRPVMLRRGAQRATVALLPRAAAARATGPRATAACFQASAASAAAAAVQQAQPRSSFLPWLLLAVPLVALPAAAAADDGVARTLYFNAHALPVLGHYRAAEAYLRATGRDTPSQRAETFAPLHDTYAKLALHVIRSLRGFYVKIGQLGVTRSDFVARQYIDACETLQDACPFEPPEYVHGLLARSLGRPWNEVFASLDPEPLGAASIGQVHRAVLHDGRTVAVKFQYPGVEELFRGDLRTIRAFCKLAQPEQLPVLDEIERAFLTEFDYEREAAALQAAADALARSPFAARVAIPRPLPELCSKQVLVMEFLDGEKLVDALRLQYAEMAASRGVSLSQLRDEWAATSAAAGTAAGKRPSAPRATPRWVRWTRAAAVAAADAAHNAALLPRNAAAKLCGRELLPLRRTRLPVDADDILALLAAVHARNIFVDGLYNGDSHPGNILLLRDGRIGLLDWGQARALAPEHRAALARIVVALADDDRRAAVEGMRAAGYKTVHSDDDLCWRIACIAFDRDDREVTQGKDLQAFMEQQAKLDPVVHTADALVMPSRNSLLLRGLGIALGRPISVARAWRDEAARFLHAHPEL